jgi:aminoglycoside/choline kinase family phosphotransferase
MQLPDPTLAPGAWLDAAGIVHSNPRAWRMPGGGSDRVMTRVWPRGDDPHSLVLVQSPNPQTFGGPLNENHSFWYVGGLLRDAGGHGPALVAERLDQGWYFVEDLGDTLLLSLVEEAGRDDARVGGWMGEVLEILLDLQLRLDPIFDPSKVHALPYDLELMTVWESGYCRERFLEGLLGLGFDRMALEAECLALARRVEAGTPKGILFRDFQSTNVLRSEGRWRIIDFQGARLGPPQYDVASFVLDPYLRLPRALRERLVEGFAARREERGGGPAGDFMAQFPAVAAHRMMQALGAYGLLSKVKGKWWFLQHVPAALGHLRELLEAPFFESCPELRRVMETAHRQVEDGALERLRAEAGA